MEGSLRHAPDRSQGLDRCEGFFYDSRRTFKLSTGQSRMGKVIIASSGRGGGARGGRGGSARGVMAAGSADIA